ncbi:MAG TPA: hypothetical protein DCZ95_15270 [Verrucomicrobia bacterium]|nr:MAG: hypothetical protein A2X46_19025 [Lentisphaerae bacterium GWF2_57_35]HBA85445.1 hypothetical protein [Verrucomicrobiota bacterium]
MKWTFKVRQALAVGLLLTICTSCFYSRLLSFKNQLKAFDKYVAVSNDGSTLDFLKPVVKPDDLTDLTGFPPTFIEQKPGGEQEHAYYYRSLSESAPPQMLCFKIRYNADGLTAFDYPVAMAQVLGTNLIVSAAKAVGKSRLIQREYKLDWASQCTNLTAELVPSIEDVLEVFGPAQSGSNSSLGVWANYTFVLDQAANSRLRTNATLKASFQFDPSNRLLRHGVVLIGKLQLVVEIPPVAPQSAVLSQARPE